MAQKQHKPQWRRLNPATRREAIVDVASHHFSTKPYDAVSTLEIATEAGVNRGLIHHYVGTKRELYLEVLRRNLQIPSFPPLVALGSSDDFERALAEGIDVWLDEVEHAPGPWLAFQRATVGPGRDPEVEQLIHDAREAAIDTALKVRFEGETAPPAVRGLLSSLGALAVQAIVEWLELRRLTREQVRALILHMALSLWLKMDDVLGEAHPTDGKAPESAGHAPAGRG